LARAQAQRATATSRKRPFRGGGRRDAEEHEPMTTAAASTTPRMIQMSEAM